MGMEAQVVVSEHYCNDDLVAVVVCLAKNHAASGV